MSTGNEIFIAPGDKTKVKINPMEEIEQKQNPKRSGKVACRTGRYGGIRKRIKLDFEPPG